MVAGALLRRTRHGQRRTYQMFGLGQLCCLVIVLLLCTGGGGGAAGSVGVAASAVEPVVSLAEGSPSSGPASGGTRLILSIQGLPAEGAPYACEFVPTFESGPAVGSRSLLSFDRSVASCTSPIWSYSASNTSVIRLVASKPGLADVHTSIVFLYSAVVSSATPVRVPASGGSTVTLRGHGFPASTSGCTLNGIPVQGGFVVVSPNEVHCTLPAVAVAGSQVLGLEGIAGPSLSVEFFPNWHSVLPSSGVVTGGFSVTVSGGGFLESEKEAFICVWGSLWHAVRSVASVISAAELVCEAPAWPAGLERNFPTGVPFTILGAELSLDSNTPMLFLWHALLGDVLPSHAAAWGGSDLTVVGAGFDCESALVCAFGSGDQQPAAIRSSTSAVCSAPRWPRSADTSTLHLRCMDTGEMLLGVQNVTFFAGFNGVSPSPSNGVFTRPVQLSLSIFGVLPGTSGYVCDFGDNLPTSQLFFTDVWTASCDLPGTLWPKVRSVTLSVPGLPLSSVGSNSTMLPWSTNINTSVLLWLVPSVEGVLPSVSAVAGGGFFTVVGQRFSSPWAADMTVFGVNVSVANDSAAVFVMPSVSDSGIVTVPIRLPDLPYFGLDLNISFVDVWWSGVTIPATGLSSLNGTVIVQGVGLSSNMSCVFGNNILTVSLEPDGSCEVSEWPGEAGLTTLSIAPNVHLEGQAQFYVAFKAAWSNVSPSLGRSALGGQRVTVSGAGFSSELSLCAWDGAGSTPATVQGLSVLVCDTPHLTQRAAGEVELSILGALGNANVSFEPAVGSSTEWVLGSGGGSIFLIGGGFDAGVAGVEYSCELRNGSSGFNASGDAVALNASVVECFVPSWALEPAGVVDLYLLPLAESPRQIEVRPAVINVQLNGFQCKGLVCSGAAEDAESVVQVAAASLASDRALRCVFRWNNASWANIGLPSSLLVDAMYRNTTFATCVWKSAVGVVVSINVSLEERHPTQGWRTVLFAGDSTRPSGVRVAALSTTVSSISGGSELTAAGFNFGFAGTGGLSCVWTLRGSSIHSPAVVHSSVRVSCIIPTWPHGAGVGKVSVAGAPNVTWQWVGNVVGLGGGHVDVDGGQLSILGFGFCCSTDEFVGVFLNGLSVDAFVADMNATWLLLHFNNISSNISGVGGSFALQVHHLGTPLSGVSAAVVVAPVLDSIAATPLTGDMCPGSVVTVSGRGFFRANGTGACSWDGGILDTSFVYVSSTAVICSVPSIVWPRPSSLVVTGSHSVSVAVAPSWWRVDAPSSVLTANVGHNITVIGAGFDGTYKCRFSLDDGIVFSSFSTRLYNGGGVLCQTPRLDVAAGAAELALVNNESTVAVACNQSMSDSALRFTQAWDSWSVDGGAEWLLGAGSAVLELYGGGFNTSYGEYECELWDSSSGVYKRSEAVAVSSLSVQCMTPSWELQSAGIVQLRLLPLSGGLLVEVKPAVVDVQMAGFICKGLVCSGATSNGSMPEVGFDAASLAASRRLRCVFKWNEAGWRTGGGVSPIVVNATRFNTTYAACDRIPSVWPIDAPFSVNVSLEEEVAISRGWSGISFASDIINASVPRWVAFSSSSATVAGGGILTISGFNFNRASGLSCVWSVDGVGSNSSIGTVYSSVRLECPIPSWAYAGSTGLVSVQDDTGSLLLPGSADWRWEPHMTELSVAALSPLGNESYIVFGGGFSAVHNYSGYLIVAGVSFSVELQYNSLTSLTAVTAPLAGVEASESAELRVLYTLNNSDSAEMVLNPVITVERLSHLSAAYISASGGTLLVNGGGFRSGHSYSCSIAAAHHNMSVVADFVSNEVLKCHFSAWTAAATGDALFSLTGVSAVANLSLSVVAVWSNVMPGRVLASGELVRLYGDGFNASGTHECVLVGVRPFDGSALLNVSISAFVVSSQELSCLIPAYEEWVASAVVLQVVGIQSTDVITLDVVASVVTVLPRSGRVTGDDKVTVMAHGLDAGVFYICQFGLFTSHVGALPSNSTSITCATPNVTAAGVVGVAVLEGNSSGLKVAGNSPLFEFRPVWLGLNTTAALTNVSTVVRLNGAGFNASVPVRCLFRFGTVLSGPVWCGAPDVELFKGETVAAAVFASSSIVVCEVPNVGLYAAQRGVLIVQEQVNGRWRDVWHPGGPQAFDMLPAVLNASGLSKDYLLHTRIVASSSSLRAVPGCSTVCVSGNHVAYARLSGDDWICDSPPLKTVVGASDVPTLHSENQSVELPFQFQLLGPVMNSSSNGALNFSDIVIPPTAMLGHVPLVMGSAAAFNGTCTTAFTELEALWGVSPCSSGNCSEQVESLLDTVCSRTSSEARKPHLLFCCWEVCGRCDEYSGVGVCKDGTCDRCLPLQGCGTFGKHAAGTSTIRGEYQPRITFYYQNRRPWLLSPAVASSRSVSGHHVLPDWAFLSAGHCSENRWQQVTTSVFLGSGGSPVVVDAQVSSGLPVLGGFASSLSFSTAVGTFGVRNGSIIVSDDGGSVIGWDASLPDDLLFSVISDLSGYAAVRHWPHNSVDRTHGVTLSVCDVSVQKGECSSLSGCLVAFFPSGQAQLLDEDGTVMSVSVSIIDGDELFREAPSMASHGLHFQLHPDQSGSAELNVTASGSSLGSSYWDTFSLHVMSCGDGIQNGEEACDDGNADGDDGCSAECTLEAGFSCNKSAGVDTCSSICGDSLRVGDEECDDGNEYIGDTCGTWLNLCALPYNCGDGFRRDCNTSCSNCSCEVCDDGNVDEYDGCSSNCTVEDGWRCDGGSVLGSDACSTICGDGVKVAGHEECDDGNTHHRDGCSPTCGCEQGYSCESVVPSPICGDELVVGNESCDDGNTVSGDGCGASCTVEEGYGCVLKRRINVSLLSEWDGVYLEGNGLVNGRPHFRGGASDNVLYWTPADDGRWSITHPGAVLEGLVSPGCAVTTAGSCVYSAGYSFGDLWVAKLAATYNDSFWERIGWVAATDDQALNGTISEVPSRSVCTQLCGDGRSLDAESCDDGNAESGDGCSTQCSVEEGWSGCAGGDADRPDLCWRLLIPDTVTVPESQRFIFSAYVVCSNSSYFSNGSQYLAPACVANFTVSSTEDVLVSPVEVASSVNVSFVDFVDHESNKDNNDTIAVSVDATWPVVGVNASGFSFVVVKNSACNFLHGAFRVGFVREGSGEVYFSETPGNAVAAVDAGIQSELAYSISGGEDAGEFALGHASGVLSLVRGADYDLKDSYDVVVKASDFGSPSLSCFQSISVIVVNEPPVLVQSDLTFVVRESEAVVGDLASAASDFNGSDVFYSVEGGYSAILFFSGSVLNFNNGALEFEKQSYYLVNVSVHDAFGLSSWFTVDVWIQNDLPAFASSNLNFFATEGSDVAVYLSSESGGHGPSFFTAYDPGMTNLSFDVDGGEDASELSKNSFDGSSLVVSFRHWNTSSHSDLSKLNGLYLRVGNEEKVNGRDYYRHASSGFVLYYCTYTDADVYEYWDAITSATVSGGYSANYWAFIDTEKYPHVVQPGVTGSARPSNLWSARLDTTVELSDILDATGWVVSHLDIERSKECYSQDCWLLEACLMIPDGSGGMSCATSLRSLCFDLSSWVLKESGSCGQQAISSLGECETAAGYLGLSLSAPNVDTSSASLPPGCFIDSNNDFVFNSYSSSSVNCNGRRCLCREASAVRDGDPVPNHRFCSESGWMGGSDNPCDGTWDGITCSSSQVTSINLARSSISYDLSGRLPPEWSALRKLTSIDFTGQSFFGELPPSWSALTDLTSVLLSANELHGTIPAWWSQLTLITTLELHGNSMGGSMYDAGSCNDSSGCSSGWRSAFAELPVPYDTHFTPDEPYLHCFASALSEGAFRNLPHSQPCHMSAYEGAAVVAGSTFSFNTPQQYSSNGANQLHVEVVAYDGSNFSSFYVNFPTDVWASDDRVNVTELNGFYAASGRTVNQKPVYENSASNYLLYWTSFVDISGDSQKYWAFIDNERVPTVQCDEQGCSSMGPLSAAGGNSWVAKYNSTDNSLYEFFEARSTDAASTWTVSVNGSAVPYVMSSRTRLGADWTTEVTRPNPILPGKTAANVTVETVDAPVAFTDYIVQSFNIPEGSSSVGSVVASDPGRGAYVYYYIAGGKDSSSFQLSPSSPSDCSSNTEPTLSFVSNRDFENPNQQGSVTNRYSVVIGASDCQGGGDAFQTFVVDVYNTNPWFTSSATSHSINEGDTQVTTITGDDEENSGVSFYNIGGAHSAAFSITTGGVLSFKNAPDHETKATAYTVTIEIRDTASPAGKVQRNHQVTVNNVAPTFTSGTSFSIDEGSTASVTTLSGSDIGGSSVSFHKVAGADADKFTITTAGVLSFTDDAPDYESENSAAGSKVYTVKIELRDTASPAGKVQRNHQVTVNNVAPYFDPSSPSATMNENSVDTFLSGYGADPVSDSVITYSLVAGQFDTNLFNIDSSDGRLTFKSAPDFEDPQSVNSDNFYRVRVSISDGHATTATTISVTVVDVSE